MLMATEDVAWSAQFEPILEALNSQTLSFSSARDDSGKDNIPRALDRSITRVELDDGSWVSTQGLVFSSLGFIYLSDPA